LHFILLWNLCIASKHKFGDFKYGNEYFKRELLNKVSDSPKNYVIHFSLLADGFKYITYAEIDVLYANSTGEIKVSGLNINAKVTIPNTKHGSATISVFGESNLPFGYMEAFRRMEILHFQSLTYIYVKKTLPPPIPKLYAQNAIGNRQPGDQLIYFESRNVTNSSRFPSRGFQYSGDEYITYVGFSFNSPTAMVLVNTSHVGEQEFNAVAYDMNTPHFMANMSVYGIIAKERPKEFLGVI